MACAVLLGTSGCDELDARRNIQEAGKLYQKGKYPEAAALYEQVLEKVSTGEVAEIAHYNAGITYNKMFRPGVETPENLKVAQSATEHFGEYLEIKPDDTTVIGLMTQVWLDSGQHENALQYWQREHAKNPKDSEIISIVAGIHQKAGEWEAAIEWYYKEADVLSSPDAKANAYMNVGKITSNKLYNRTKVVGLERLRIADIGIAAVQKALALQSDSPDVHNYLGALYRLRSEAHQASWAQMIDYSHGLHHQIRWAALKKEQEQEQAGGAPAGDDKAADDSATDTPEGEGEASEEGGEDQGAGDEGAEGDGSAAAQGQEAQGEAAARDQAAKPQPARAEGSANKPANKAPAKEPAKAPAKEPAKAPAKKPAKAEEGKAAPASDSSGQQEASAKTPEGSTEAKEGQVDSTDATKGKPTEGASAEEAPGSNP